MEAAGWCKMFAMSQLNYRGSRNTRHIFWFLIRIDGFVILKT